MTMMRRRKNRDTGAWENIEVAADHPLRTQVSLEMTVSKEQLKADATDFVTLEVVARRRLDNSVDTAARELIIRVRDNRLRLVLTEGVFSGRIMTSVRGPIVIEAPEATPTRLQLFAGPPDDRPADVVTDIVV